jgi:regulator of protease activity HflC (stomatin/prohibitin superfamily)
MVAIILTIIFIGLGFGMASFIKWAAIIYCDVSEDKGEKIKKACKLPVWCGAALLILLAWGFATIRIIPTGTVGVKTTFGVVSGRASEGFNIIAPWEDIVSMNTKIQKQSFEGLSASTKDSQSITNINIDVNYKLNPDKAEEIYASVGESYQATLMAPLLTQFIKDRLALYNAENLVSERNKIVDDITVQLQENLGAYGIDIVAVSLSNYDFSAEFSASLERKAVAAKEIEVAKNNQEKAKVEAETNRIKSEQLTEAVLMEKLIDAIKNGTGTYVIDTSNLSIGVR